MATITLSNGSKINAPDGLEKEQYDEIVEDASAKLGFSAPTGDTPTEETGLMDTLSKFGEDYTDSISGGGNSVVDTAGIPGYGKTLDTIGSTLKGAGSEVLSGLAGLQKLGNKFNRAITPEWLPWYDQTMKLYDVHDKVDDTAQEYLHKKKQEDFSKVKEKHGVDLNQNLLDIPQIPQEYMSKGDDFMGKAKNFGISGTNKLAEVVSGLTKPENLAILGTGMGVGKFGGPLAKTIEKGAATTFLPGLAEGAISGGEKLKKGIEDGDENLAGEGLAELISFGTFTAGVGKHVLGGGTPGAVKLDLKGKTKGSKVPSTEIPKSIEQLLPQQFKEPVRGKFNLDKPPVETPLSKGAVNEAISKYIQRTDPTTVTQTQSPAGAPTNLVNPQGLPIHKGKGNQFQVKTPQQGNIVIPETFRSRTPLEQLQMKDAAKLEQKLLPPKSNQSTQGMQINVDAQGKPVNMTAIGEKVFKPDANLKNTYVKPVKDMSTMDLVKTIIKDDTGSIGKMSQKTKLSREASTELMTRAKEYAKKNGVSIEQASKLILENPKILDVKPQTSSGLVDASGKPLSSKVPETFSKTAEMKIEKPQIIAENVPDLTAETTLKTKPRTVEESIESVPDSSKIDTTFESTKKTVNKIYNDTATAKAKETVNGIPETITEKNRVAFKNANQKLDVWKESLSEPVERKIMHEKFEKFYREARNSLGLKNAGQQSTKLETWQNTTNVGNQIQTATGVEAGQYTMKMVEADYIASHKAKALKDIGNQKAIKKRLSKQKFEGKNLTGEVLSDLMQYVESKVDASGKPTGEVSWNPQALVVKRGKKVIDNIPAYEGKTPSPKIMEDLFNMRKVYNEFHKYASNLKDDVGFHSRYVPRFDKVPFFTMNTLFGEKSSIFDPAMLKKRSGRDVPLETDFWKIHERYINSLAKSEVYPEVVNLGRNVDAQLRLAGYGEEALYLEKTLQKALGLKDPRGMRKYYAEDIAKMGSKQLEQFLKNEGIQPGNMEKFMHELQQQMYHSYIGLNVKNLMAQVMQLELAGSADLGLAGIAKTLKYKTKKPFLSKSDKALLLDVKERLTSAEYNPLSLSREGLKQKMGGNVSDLLKMPGKPGLKMQGFLDSSGRNTIFLAARENFIKSKKPLKLLENLSESEKQTILDAQKMGGKEAGGKEYGVILAHKIMHRFSAVDRPLGMKEGLAKYIPFTGFSRGEANKLRDDIRAGRYKQVAKRLAYPTIMATMMSQGDLDKFMYFHPVLSTFGLAGMSVTPSLSNATQAIQRGSSLPKKFGGAAKELARGTALGRVLIDQEKLLGKDKKKKKSKTRRRRRTR